MITLRHLTAALLLASSSIASALTVHSVTQPSESPGYIKVIVKPESAAMASDILFVIDNSGSMDPHQQKLSQNIPSMINMLSKFSGQLNVGMITTDMMNPSESGRLQGTPAVLQSADTNFVSLLSSRLMPGTLGDGAAESPLGAIAAALSEPLRSSTNAGFLRPNVPLNLILVTDEDDQSKISDQDFLGFLKTLKPAGDVSLFSVIPTQNSGNCAVNMPTGRIERITRALNGEIHDLCNDNWGEKLRSIGASIGKQVMRTIRLPTEPVTATIQVKFGNLTLVAGDAQGGWVYDRKQMAVVIGEDVSFASQPQGSELEITFVPKYWQK